MAGGQEGSGPPSGPPRAERKTAAVDMLRRALEGGVGGSQQEKDAFIEAFMKLQISQEDRLQALERDNRQLRQVGVGGLTLFIDFLFLVLHTQFGIKGRGGVLSLIDLLTYCSRHTP